MIKIVIAQPQMCRTSGMERNSRLSNMPAFGRTATVESERKRFDRRRSQFDPSKKFELLNR